MSEPSMQLGVDLGGTKIEAIVLDAEGAERARRRVPTPAAEGYAAVLSAVVDLVESIESSLSAHCSVGIGTPGALSPATGLLKNANTVCLNGRPFDRDLAAALSRPVRLANDADCFALSEATDGAGKGRDSVFGVIVGTGTGGGLAIGGRLLQGPNAIAGEWGHNPLPWPSAAERPGPECYCGKRGCIETWLCGPGIAADHLAQTGESFTAQELARRAASGDRAAAASLERHVDRFARALSSVLNIVDPGVVVLGGGVSGLPGLPEAVAAKLDAHVFGAGVRTPVLRAAHGDSSGVRGAAWLGASR